MKNYFSKNETIENVLGTYLPTKSNILQLDIALLFHTLAFLTIKAFENNEIVTEESLLIKAIQGQWGATPTECFVMTPLSLNEILLCTNEAQQDPKWFLSSGKLCTYLYPKKDLILPNNIRMDSIRNDCMA